MIVVDHYDVVVVGVGCHAGCEAALAAARMEKDPLATLFHG